MTHPAVPDRGMLRSHLLSLQDELKRVEAELGKAAENLPEDPVERIDDILTRRHQEARHLVRETYVTIEMIGACFAVDIGHEGL